jgi:flagellar biosynthetic protein FliR
MLTVYQIADTLLQLTWALMRVSGLVLMAPILGAVFVPPRVRIVLATILAVAMLPVLGELPTYSPFSIQGFLAVARELLVGLTIGFVLKLVVEAAVFAGQVVSMGMGLSFAMVVDPQAGSVPLLGRLYIIVATLLLLTANAHLALIAVLAESYAVLPLGEAALAPDGARALVMFASVMFTGAMQLALPAVVAILMVNVAFGVISRAAPTLNLFAVGFPITLLMGFIVMIMSIRSQGVVWDAQFDAALLMMAQLLGGG